MAVTLFSGAAFTTVIQPVTVAAKKHSVKKAKVVKYYHHNYQNLKLKKGYLYNSKTLTKKIHKAKTYRNHTFKSKTQVKLKKSNGKKALYYFVYSGKVKGYIWSGYIKHSKVKTSTNQNSTKPSQANNSDGSTTNTTITKAQLMTLINQSPDLNPTGQLLSLTKTDYNEYSDILYKNFNLLGSAGNFKHHQQNISVTDSVLVPYVQAAINKWNSALGQTVFTMDSSQPTQLTIKTKEVFGVKGQFDEDNAEIDIVPSEITNQKDSVSTDNQYEALQSQLKQANATWQQQKQQIQTKYQGLLQQLNQQATQGNSQFISQQRQQLQQQERAEQQAAEKQYYTTQNSIDAQEKDLTTKPLTVEEAGQSGLADVILHELGHDLGLEHSPYEADTMFAESPLDGGVNQTYYKYYWNGPKDPDQASKLKGAYLSQRDIDRAKLTEAMGLW